MRSRGVFVSRGPLAMARVRPQRRRSGRHGVRRGLPFPVRLRLARLRSLAVRHRLLRRVLGGLLVVTIAVSVVSARRSAQVARQQWGDTVQVVVVTDDVPVGASWASVGFEVASRPVALVPADALTRPPSQDRVVAPLVAGEVVTRRALASTREQQRVLPDGHRAVGFPIDAATPLLRVGDVVDLIVVEDPFGPDGSGHRALRPPAIVLAVDEDTATLAVDAGIVSAVVSARAAGRVSLAVR